MLDAFIEHDIYTGSPFVISDRYLRQILATLTAAIDFGNLLGFNRTAVVERFAILSYALAIASTCSGTIILVIL